MTLRAEALERYLTQRLVVLALWQPHAIFTVAPDPAHDGRPAKRHETRHWYPRQACPFAVAIHAAKKYDKTTAPYFTEEPFRSAIKRCGYYPGDPRPLLRRTDWTAYHPVPLGAIIGLATVVRIVSPQKLTFEQQDRGIEWIDPMRIDDDDRAMGYWMPHRDDPNRTRFGWELADTFLLPTPIEHSGRQEPLYDVDLSTREEITRQLRHAEVAP